MDSVKVWNLEKGAQADIVMKPQSIVFDMRGNNEYLYRKQPNRICSCRVQQPQSVRHPLLDVHVRDQP